MEAPGQTGACWLLFWHACGCFPQTFLLRTSGILFTFSCIYVLPFLDLTQISFIVTPLVVCAFSTQYIYVEQVHVELLLENSCLGGKLRPYMSLFCVPHWIIGWAQNSRCYSYYILQSCFWEICHCIFWLSCVLSDWKILGSVSLLCFEISW